MAVVGAGISGLAVGHELRRRGAEFDVFEASASAGGVIRSTRSSAGLLEWGPQRLRLVPSVRRIVEDLGLVDRLLHADSSSPLFVVRGGKMHTVPRSLRDVLGGSLLGPAGRLRVLAEPVTAAVRATETVAEALTRKFGREAYRAFLGPLFGGLYASDPSQMPASHSLHGFLLGAGGPRSLLLYGLRLSTGSSPACSFRDGLGELPAAMARALGGDLRLRLPIDSMSRSTGGWMLAAGGASHGPYAAVVLTVAADEAARILAAAARPAADRLGRLRYNRLAIVHLQAAGPTIEGFGYQVAYGEGLETRGVTFNDSLFDRGVVTAFLGGALNPRLPDWPSDRIAAVAEREFLCVTGRSAVTLEVSRPRVPAYDTSWGAMDGLQLPPGVHLCASYIGRPGIAGRFAQAQTIADEIG